MYSAAAAERYTLANGHEMKMSCRVVRRKKHCKRSARICLQRSLEAVSELGGAAETVIGKRMYLTPESDWRGAVRANAEAFDGIDPCQYDALHGRLHSRRSAG